MKLFKIIATLYIFLSFLTNSCASNQISEQGDGAQLSTPLGLPRKLKVNDEKLMASRKQDENLLSGKLDNQEAKTIHVNKGSSSSSTTKGLDEADELEFLTMDYRRVRKRRPVHNKSIPTSSTTP